MTSLSVQNVSYNYGAKRALDDISFDLNAGRFCALLGPNGAGKSTLFSLLTRLLIAPTGRIEIAGHDIAKSPRAALASLGVVFQSPTLDLDLSVLRNLRYFAALQGISGEDAESRITQALERVEMLERKGEKARDLNGGHKRRMEIARALIHQPKVLLLDEPTVGLDAESRKAITDHAHHLASTGLLVLWATHLVDEIEPDDTVIVLHKGKIRTQDTARTIAGDRTLIDAFIEMTNP